MRSACSHIIKINIIYSCVAIIYSGGPGISGELSENDSNKNNSNNDNSNNNNNNNNNNNDNFASVC